MYKLTKIKMEEKTNQENEIEGKDQENTYDNPLQFSMNDVIDESLLEFDSII